ncbi:MAG: ABC transporter substrate-binding protein [Actinomycetota bacterium]|nr:ABC transporter substrate-binding protein [Actinomycetota bacterium]
MAKKIYYTVSLVLVLLLISVPVSLSGCRGKMEVKSITETIEVKDGGGELIRLASPAERIVVISPSALEILSGLGAMDKVVEVDNYSVISGDPLAEGFEGAGDSFGLNVEKIAELDPDILIAVSGGPDEDYRKVEELGIEIYRVISINGIEGVYEEITNISRLTGLEDKGEEIVKELKKSVDGIYNKVKDLSDEDRPEVFYEVWNDPLMSAGMDTFTNDLIEKAGGINIVAQDNITGWPEYSVETLIEKNPDVIVAPMSLAADSSVITGDERFSSIKAVKNGRVYVVPDNPVSRPSQNLDIALEMLSKAFHPDIFGEF